MGFFRSALNLWSMAIPVESRLRISPPPVSSNRGIGRNVAPNKCSDRFFVRMINHFKSDAAGSFFKFSTFRILKDLDGPDHQSFVIRID